MELQKHGHLRNWNGVASDVLSYGLAEQRLMCYPMDTSGYPMLSYG